MKRKFYSGRGSKAKAIPSVWRAEANEEMDKIWGCSSAGRAPALQAGGQEFDPPHLHQTSKDVKTNIQSMYLEN